MNSIHKELEAFTRFSDEDYLPIPVQNLYAIKEMDGRYSIIWQTLEAFYDNISPDLSVWGLNKFDNLKRRHREAEALDRIIS